MCPRPSLPTPSSCHAASSRCDAGDLPWRTLERPGLTRTTRYSPRPLKAVFCPRRNPLKGHHFTFWFCLWSRDFHQHDLRDRSVENPVGLSVTLSRCIHRNSWVPHCSTNNRSAPSVSWTYPAWIKPSSL